MLALVTGLYEDHFISIHRLLRFFDLWSSQRPLASVRVNKWEVTFFQRLCNHVVNQDYFWNVANILRVENCEDKGKKNFLFRRYQAPLWCRKLCKNFYQNTSNEHFSLIFFLVISRRGYRASYQGNFMIHIQNPFPNNLLRLFGGILNYRHIKITVRIRPINRNLIYKLYNIIVLVP